MKVATTNTESIGYPTVKMSWSYGH